MAIATRPFITVHSLDGDVATDFIVTLPIPDVMHDHIRPDIVNVVHSNICKNDRQPYTIICKVGHQTSSESWGIDCVVSRIPCVAGGGTHRAGQASFRNMCCGGRMFSPTRIWRKWYRKINVNQKRHVVVSAIAASAVPSPVLACGHHIELVPEFPLVVGDSAERVEKTKEAIKLLNHIEAFPADTKKAKNSHGIRPDNGKTKVEESINTYQKVEKSTNVKENPKSEVQA
ncbi:hypothetical protein RYX36_004777 [Vicia faba]